MKIDQGVKDIDVLLQTYQSNDHKYGKITVGIQTERYPTVDTTTQVFIGPKIIDRITKNCLDMVPHLQPFFTDKENLLLVNLFYLST